MATATITVTEAPPMPSAPLHGIRSNVGMIRQEHIEPLRPTAKDTPIFEMRRRLDEDGYLFVKNLIPRADVLNVRKDYFEHYQPTGILQPGTLPEDGIFNSAHNPHDHRGIGAGLLPPEEFQIQTLISSHVRPEYLKFLEHPNLRQMVRDLMGWKKETLLRRTMLRHNIPGGLSTGIHYDKLFLRDGGAYFLTAWVPIGDISIQGGGLLYLSDSTTLGKSIEKDFTARAASFSEEERISAFNANMSKFGTLSDDADDFLENKAKGKGRWLTAAYEAGDVVFHDPYAIHGSSKNQDPQGRIRLSTDLRFYEEGSDIDQRWMKYWTPGDGL
ncbi:hypothetical protein MMC22_009270 [Lobaria immixta]|nr:hypothetical protein [Lobaria immixta]